MALRPPDWSSSSPETMMRLVDPIIAELEQEAESTRRVLGRIPEGRLSWRPHPRSMSLGQLALHIATTPGAVAEVAAPLGSSCRCNSGHGHVLWRLPQVVAVVCAEGVPEGMSFPPTDSGNSCKAISGSQPCPARAAQGLRHTS